MLVRNNKFKQKMKSQPEGASYSSIEAQEVLLSELESLFDRPCLIPVAASATTPFKLGLEKDPTNTFLITNPLAIFRVFNKDAFLPLPETVQCAIIDRLDEILLKCPHNVLTLTEHMVNPTQGTLARFAQTAIIRLKEAKQAPAVEANYDILLLIVHLALKLSTKKPQTSRKLVGLVRKLTTGQRFQRCHVEYINQYLKVKCAQRCLKGRGDALIKVDTALKMLQHMYEQRFEAGGPSNFFYFSGYLSGIQVNVKNLPVEFTKGFSAAMWFCLPDHGQHTQQIQDDKNLPILFNCFIAGFGGFECYFNQRRLLYRTLPKAYSPPNTESNGVPILGQHEEFTPGRWYFFAIEHERPFMTRPQVTAIVNDRQVLTLPMDYPKVQDKNARITMIMVCQNFVGALSSFMLFKEPLGNLKQLIHLGHQTYEYGIFTNQQLHHLKLDSKSDAKLMEKLLLFYTPERTHNKMVYDCIEMRDGELMINSGVCNQESTIAAGGSKNQKLFKTGGLQSLLPMLELIRGITLFPKESLATLDVTVNGFLKLVVHALQSRGLHAASEGNAQHFITVLFYLLTKLPNHCVNKQTIQYLADVRFLIGDQAKLQESFFRSLMMSCDFWINTHSLEVIDEFWDFVKNIYQQNLVYFNRVFSIQNLIDLMVKISDIRDGHCCDFHKESFQYFYQGSVPKQSPPLMAQPSIDKWVLLDSNPIMEEDELIKPGNLSDQDRAQETHGGFDVRMDGRIYHIERYVGPIAGVLEKVLTIGGNEVLDQIQHIAKSLAMKSSPCFHLQMLKLLKVLLLDSKEDRHCASPSDFASSFLKANGLQILLYLCSNSSFDVKAMCVKLIDVLSSHSQMIKVAIDPDVITYLCSVILPKQMMESASMHLSRKNQVFEEPKAITPPNLQYKVMSDEEELPPQREEPFLEDSQDLEHQMNQLLAKQPPLIAKKKEKKMQFGDGLFLEEDSDEEEPAVTRQPYQRSAEDDMVDEPLLQAKPPPPAPKNRSGASMKFDFDSEESEPVVQKGKRGFGKQKNSTIQEIADEDEEDEVPPQQPKSDDEDIFTHADTLAQSNRLFMNTQKIPSSKAKSKGGVSKIPAFKPKKQLALDIEDKGGFKPSIRPSIGAKPKLQKKLETLVDDEEEVMPPGRKFSENKGDDPNNFSNENVMSKSNLRQPKSFNFGFPGGDDSDEEAQQDTPFDEQEDQNFVTLPRNLLQVKQKRPADLQEQPEGKLFLGDLGATGATQDDFNTEKTQEDIEQEDQPMTEEEQKEEDEAQLILPKKSTKKQAVISYQKRGKLFTNANQKLNIDTDAINELFNYGGEQGKIMMSEDEEQRQFEAEIEELASMCMAAMSRKRVTDPIVYKSKREKTTFESKYLANEGKKQKKSKNPRQQFMTPQSVRGIKKIEFQMSQEERNDVLEGSRDPFNLGSSFGESSGDGGSKSFSGLKSGLFTSNTILEELEANDSSRDSNKSSANKHSTGDINFPGLLSGSLGDALDGKLPSETVIQKEDHHPQVPFQKIEEAVAPFALTINDSTYTKELENLYTSCLEWIISRAPSVLNENIVIDDCDKVGYQPAISLLLTLVTYSNNKIRQQALNDFLQLANVEPTNGVQIMMHPQFHAWLLDLLMPYQDLANKYQMLSDQAQAVYDIGCKLHTVLLRNACTSQEEDAYKKVNFVSRWASTVQTQLSNGQRERSEQDVEIAHKLSRVLLTLLLGSLKDEAVKSRPTIGKHSTSPVWHNIVYISYLVEELIFGSHSKESALDVPHSELGRDFSGQPLFKWIHDQDYLMYYFGSNEKSLWAEWDILEAMFNLIDSLYPERIMKGLNLQLGQNSIDEQIFNLLEKVSQGEDINQIVEIMVQDQSPYKAAQNQFPQPVQTKPAKKGILGNVFGSNHKKDKEQSQAAAHEAQQHVQTKSNEQQSFMWNIMNMLCIALTQSDTKQLVTLWLERFERFTKFLMIISESWKSRHIATLYNQYQRKFIDVLTFALAFLFHEIHAKNRGSPTPTNSTTTPLSQQSPKDHMFFNKLYAQSLKNIMIFFINIIEYSKMKQTPSQLDTHVSACRFIFNNVLVKSYTHQQQADNLISSKDITRLKQTDYEDFPECFQHDEWKVTFFYNETIRKIVKSRLNVGALQAYQGKRKSYAQHQCETQGSGEKIKEDILRRMQYDTIDIIGSLSEEEFERKNRVSLLNDNFIREQGISWKHLKKQQIGGRGMWKCEPTRQKITWYRLSDGTRAIMEDAFGPSRFEYFHDMPDLEKKIFEPEHEEGLDLLLLGYSKLQTHLENPFQRSLSGGMAASHIKLTDEDMIEEEETHQIARQFPTSEPVQFKKQRSITSSAVQNGLSLPHDSQNQVRFFSRMLTEREKQALKKQYIPILKEYIYSQRMHLMQNVKFKEILTDLRCEILKPFYKKSGSITLTSHEIIFFEDIYHSAHHDQSDYSNIFFFNHTLTDQTLYYRVTPLQDLKELQRRRWLGRKTALEVFLASGKTLLLNFQSTDDREQFAKKVLRQRNQRCCNLRYYDTLDPRRILKKRELTEKWMQWKISNFEYINLLNQLSGRSYNDLSQYPIFPWILTDYTSQVAPELSTPFNQAVGAPQGFRDLNKNMQLLGSAERQAEFKRKYDDPDSFESLQERFHCGSHYSNPGIVLHYLCRVSPYIDAMVQLHGKSLDSPDRSFSSIQASLVSALNDHADVRELVPEFYYVPELFLNQNALRFGKKQDGEQVGDVNLPPWCQNDPYQMVAYLREAFESAYVSSSLNGWIDFIFGCKQRDTDAERALNTFSRLTYEDGVDLDNISDPLIKKGYQEQIYNYGQTPSQLFQKGQKHPPRLPRNQALKNNAVVDSQAKIKVYKPVLTQQPQQRNQQSVQQTLITSEAILRAKFVDDQMIVGISKDGTATFYFWLPKPHELNPNTPFTLCEDKRRKFDNKTRSPVNHMIDLYDRSIRKFEFPQLILTTQKCVLRGGFWGGRMLVSPIEGMATTSSQASAANIGSAFESHSQMGTITTITSTKDERIVISGSKAGDVVVWIFGGVDNPQVWQARKQMCDHDSMISFIYIAEEMNMYLTSGFDGCANLYSLFNDRHFRTFRHPQLSPLHSAILTQTPLPAVAFYSREDHTWYSYSLNEPKRMLEKQREEASHVISPLIIKDSHGMDRLVYGTEKGYLVFRQLPWLKQVKRQQISTSHPVLSLIASPDRRFLLVGCGDGGLNVVTEPFKMQAPNPYLTSNTQSLANSTIVTSNSQRISLGGATQNSGNPYSQANTQASYRE